MSDNRDVQAEQEVSGVDETVQDAEVIQEEQSSPEAESDATQRIYELETALSEAQATIKAVSYTHLTLPTI